MQRSRDRHSVWMGAAVISLFACSIASATWYQGGSHDGYYDSWITGVADYPQVNNDAGATNVTDTSAFLNGTLVSTGSAPAQVTVYWARENGGRDTAAWDAADGADSHTFGAFGDVAPFDPLTHEIVVSAEQTYHYRFFATNTAGETSWAPETATFLTPAPPAVSTGPGAGVGFDVAVLSGELTGGVEAAVEFHWAETPTGIAPETWTTIDMGQRKVEPGDLDDPNPFSTFIDSLSPETNHAYRVYAENEFGTDTSEWVEFETHPTDFITTPDLGWFHGGEDDGYYNLKVHDFPLPGFTGGSLLIVR